MHDGPDEFTVAKMCRQLDSFFWTTVLGQSFCTSAEHVMGVGTVVDAMGMTILQVAPPGYAPLGDVLSIGFDPPNHPVR